MPTAAPSPSRRPPPVVPGFAEPMLLIVAAIIGVGVVYRATLSIPVTLIAAALAAVAAQNRSRVYLYPTRRRHEEAE